VVALPEAGQAEGIHWLDEIKDLRGLANACRRGGGGPRRFLAPYLTRHASALGSLSDPLPALNAIAGSIALLARRKGGAPAFGHRQPTPFASAPSPPADSRLPPG
jgi:hypothetical protein